MSYHKQKQEKSAYSSHYRDRRPQRNRSRSRSRSHSFRKNSKNHSKSSKDHKSSEYYIEKYRALYQGNLKNNQRPTKKDNIHQKIDEKDESVLFFREKYGGEIKNLFTKHSDVFNMESKNLQNDKNSQEIEKKQNKHSNSQIQGNNFQFIDRKPIEIVPSI